MPLSHTAILDRFPVPLLYPDIDADELAREAERDRRRAPHGFAEPQYAPGRDGVTGERPRPLAT